MICNKRVNCVKYAADSNVLISGSFDKTVKIWDMRSRSFQPIQTLSDFKDGVSSVDATNKEILASSTDGTLRTYDISSGLMHTDTIGEAITSMHVSHDKKLCLISCMGHIRGRGFNQRYEGIEKEQQIGGNGEVKLIDRATGKQLNKFQGHKHIEYHVECCLPPDDAHVICSSEDGSIFIWDILTGTLKQQLKGHTSVCTSLSISPKSVNIRQNSSGLPEPKIGSNSSIPDKESFVMVSGSADGSVGVWTTAEHAQILVNDGESALSSDFDYGYSPIIEDGGRIQRKSEKSAPFFETRTRLPFL